MRYDGTNLKLRVNSTDATPVATAGYAVLGNVLNFGTNYTTAVNYAGDVMQYLIFNRSLSDSEIAAYYAYFKAKYPSMSLP